MIQGLQEVEQRLRQHRIPFYLSTGEPQGIIPQFVNQYNTA